MKEQQNKVHTIHVKGLRFSFLFVLHFLNEFPFRLFASSREIHSELAAKHTHTRALNREHVIYSGFSSIRNPILRSRAF